MARMEDLLAKPAMWAIVSSAVNGACNAQIAGQFGMCHIITGLSYSASDLPATAAQVQVLNGVTVLDQLEIPAAVFAAVIHNFIRPYRCSEGALASVTMGALGAGVRGTVVLKGFTGTP